MSNVAPPDDAPARQAAFEYQVAGYGALVPLGFLLLERATGHPLALTPVAVAALGLFRRQGAYAVAALGALAYFGVFPDGLPWSRPFPPRAAGGHGRLTDFLAVGSFTLYLFALWRLISLTRHALPLEANAAAPPPTRPPPADAGREFLGLGARAVFAVAAGQLLWWLTNRLTADATQFPPLTFRRPPEGRVTPAFKVLGADVDPATVDRALVLIGLAALVAVPAGLAYWYTGLTRMTPEQGRLALLDAGWREQRRELQRQALWRTWALRRGREPRRRTSLGGRLAALVLLGLLIYLAARYYLRAAAT